VKKFLYIIGIIVAVLIVWRIVTRRPARSGPRQTMTPKQKAIDDNAPMSVYSVIVPPIAQNVTPRAGEIILRRNDPVFPDLYTLAAIGPNTNS
jgi:hypothetical protein